MPSPHLPHAPLGHEFDQRHLHRAPFGPDAQHIEIPIARGHTADVGEATAAMHATLADPAGREAVQAAIANQAIHFDLLGLQLGHFAS